MARLYVFRPDFSNLWTKDQPVLTIDDSLETVVSRLTYSRFDLPMGHHTFRLAPASKDSKVWDLQGAFEVSEEGLFYLAIWNTDPSPWTNGASGSYGKDLATATTVGVLTAAITGGFAIIPMRPLAITRSGKNPGVARFELIREDQALEFIRQCELSPSARVQ
jgi:hypothetical protein